MTTPQISILTVFSAAVLLLAAAVASLAPVASAEDSKPWVNYDESKVPEYTLPNPLICEDGSEVKTPEQWVEKRRPEILRQFTEQMYGALPEILRQDHPKFVTFEEMERDDNALDGKAIRKQIAIHFNCPTAQDLQEAATDPVHQSSDAPVAADCAHSSQTANVLIYLPKNAEKPVPCFLMMNFRGNQTIWKDPSIFFSEYFEGGQVPEEKLPGAKISRWNVAKILEAGYGLITLYYQNIAPDTDRCFHEGIFALYDTPERSKTSWGELTAWAWGLSRVMDYIETDQEIDSSRIAVAGHSRLGKTALWAGANDPRFALVISNDSGCGGAALSRREFGERVATMNQGPLARWFCLNYKKYDDHVNDLPFDQHELIALIAPRPVYVASAVEDQWADPKGEYLSALNAASVYKLLGTDAFGDVTSPELPPLNTSVGATIGYHIRSGKHDVTDFDWEMYIQFANKHFKNKK